MPIKIVPTKKKVSMPKPRPKSLKADKTESLNKNFSIGVAAANKKAGGGKVTGKVKNPFDIKLTDNRTKKEKHYKDTYKSSSPGVMIKKADGGKLKSVPEGNKGLSKLPTPVRNKMGFMKKGGKVIKKASGGLTKGMLGKDVLLGNKTPADVLKENKKKLLKKRDIKKGGK